MPAKPRVLASALAHSKPTLPNPPISTAFPPPSPSGGGNGGQAIDIIGLGQAVVDYSASVSEELLQHFDVVKGGRRVVTVQERGMVMQTLDDMGFPSQVSPGGSLANTLVGVARLARAAGKDLRVSMAGSLGNDTLGQYFSSQLQQAGVQVMLHEQLGLAAPCPQGNAGADADAGPSSAGAGCAAGEHAVQGHTGTVMVLTTPDAQRSFLSFFPGAEELQLPEPVAAAVQSSRLVIIEGYMWEAPGAEAYVHAVVAAARAAGAQVALTAGDPGVVARHRAAILRVLRAGGADILFANAEEADALVAGLAAPAGRSAPADAAAAQQPHAGGHAAALALAQLCPVVVVTDGSKGSYISAMGQLHVVPPHWTPHGPRDTCGAGDAYAAGVLYAALAGYDLRTAGEFGARVASAVIAQFGPHLGEEDAAGLVQQLPEHACPLRASGLLASLDGLTGGLQP